MMQSCMWSLGFDTQAFDSSQENLQVLCYWSCGHRPPFTKLTHAYTSKGKNWVIYGQLDLEVTSKSYKDFQIAPNFHELWSKKLRCEKWSQKKILVFDCYNLIDPME